MGPKLFGNSYSEQGFFLSFCQPSILQITRRDASGLDWQKIPRHYATKHKGAGRKKRKFNHIWVSRFLSIAKKIRVFKRKKSKGNIISNTSASIGSGRLRVLRIEDHGRQQRFITDSAQERNILIETILPVTNNEGAGLLNEVLEADSDSVRRCGRRIK